MRGDQRDAVTARRLLQRGARERSKRCRVGDDTFLNGGFQAGRKRERANGKHRVTKLQHPREKCGAARRLDAIILDGHAQNRPLPAMFVPECLRMGMDTRRRMSVNASALGLETSITLVRVGVHRSFRATEEPP